MRETTEKQCGRLHVRMPHPASLDAPGSPFPDATLPKAVLTGAVSFCRQVLLACHRSLWGCVR